jgi:hypothetical protein
LIGIGSGISEVSKTENVPSGIQSFIQKYGGYVSKKSSLYSNQKGGIKTPHGGPVFLQSSSYNVFTPSTFTIAVLLPPSLLSPPPTPPPSPLQVNIMQQLSAKELIGDEGTK